MSQLCPICNKDGNIVLKDVSLDRVKEKLLYCSVCDLEFLETWSDVEYVKSLYSGDNYIFSHNIENNKNSNLKFDEYTNRYEQMKPFFSKEKNLLEVGCGDGFGAPVVSHVVNNLTATDLDERFIEKIKQTHPYNGIIDFVAHDMIKGSFGLEFDGIFSLDVLEHIDKEFENDFMFNIVESIKSDGVCIIGMPSLESQMYASKISKLGHVNCKTGEELKIFLENFFERVFMFSMNDEIVHTGFQPMAHYLLALCVVPKKT